LKSTFWFFYFLFGKSTLRESWSCSGFPHLRFVRIFLLYFLSHFGTKDSLCPSCLPVPPPDFVRDSCLPPERSESGMRFPAVSDSSSPPCILISCSAFFRFRLSFYVTNRFFLGYEETGRLVHFLHAFVLCSLPSWPFYRFLGAFARLWRFLRRTSLRYLFASKARGPSPQLYAFLS